MSAETVIKDVSGIYCRLLDHRPVLNGEIRYMLREFEEKRNNREFARLEKSMTDSSQIQTELLPQTLQLFEENFSSIRNQVEACAKHCSKIADHEEELKQSDPLAQQRALRGEAWRVFMQRQCELSSDADEWLKKEVEELEEHYSELESKLNLPSSP